MCEIRESEVCTSYNTNECGFGYFCQFAPEEFSNERGAGVCTKIQNGYLGKQTLRKNFSGYFAFF
jgi:hypothetical protein